MEAALFDFVLDIGTLVATDVAEHFGEYPFEGVVAHLAVDGMIAVVADIEGGAVEVAGVVGGVAIVTLQLPDVFHRAHHTGDGELGDGHAFHIQAVVEGLADILQQQGGSGHEIWDGAVERINMIIGTLADIDELLLAGLGISAVLDGTYTPLVGSNNLHALAIGEGGLVVGHAENAVFLLGIDDGSSWLVSRFLIALGGRRRGQIDMVATSHEKDDGKEEDDELMLGRETLPGGHQSGTGGSELGAESMFIRIHA